MTITDVAQRAGTSIASVSRVLNGQGGVSTDTARRIQSAMGDVGYVPPSPHSRFRRNPRKRQGIHTGVVAFLVPDTDSHALRTVLMGHVLHGIEPALKKHALYLQLASLNAPDTPPDCIMQGKVDGVIVRCSNHLENLDNRLRKVPHVWILETDQIPHWGDQIVPNDQLVGQLAARFLLSRGRRRWICLNDQIINPLGQHPLMSRCSSFINAALAAGVEIRETTSTSFDTQLGQIISDGWRPDGLFFPFHETAVPAIYQSLRRHRLEPGRDINVVCCGHDEGQLRMLNPPPASVDIRPEVIGSAAVEMLMWRMAAPDSPRRQLAIEPGLIAPEQEVTQ